MTDATGGGTNRENGICEINKIMDFVRSASLKGEAEFGDEEFDWNLGGIYLNFALDPRETTVCYSRKKNQCYNVGHFHEDNRNVIDLIRDINRKDQIVHITVSPWGSRFELVNKADKKKKSRLFVRHYYSEQ